MPWQVFYQRRTHVLAAVLVALVVGFFLCKWWSSAPPTTAEAKEEVSTGTLISDLANDDVTVAQAAAIRIAKAPDAPQKLFEKYGGGLKQDRIVHLGHELGPTMRNYLQEVIDHPNRHPPSVIQKAKDFLAKLTTAFPGAAASCPKSEKKKTDPPKPKASTSSSVPPFPVPVVTLPPPPSQQPVNVRVENILPQPTAPTPVVTSNPTYDTKLALLEQGQADTKSSLKDIAASVNTLATNVNTAMTNLSTTVNNLSGSMTNFENRMTKVEGGLDQWKYMQYDPCTRRFIDPRPPNAR